jgi:hypothetical protein
MLLYVFVNELQGGVIWGKRNVNLGIARPSCISFVHNARPHELMTEVSLAFLSSPVRLAPFLIH